MPNLPTIALRRSLPCLYHPFPEAGQTPFPALITRKVDTNHVDIVAFASMGGPVPVTSAFTNVLVSQPADTPPANRAYVTFDEWVLLIARRLDLTVNTGERGRLVTPIVLDLGDVVTVLPAGSVLEFRFNEVTDFPHEITTQAIADAQALADANGATVLLP